MGHRYSGSNFEGEGKRFWECGELLCERRLVGLPRGTVYKSYVWPAILYGCTVWYVREDEIMTFRTENHGESNVWNTAHGQ